MRQLNSLEGEVEFYRREAANLRERRYELESLIGKSPAMRKLRSEIIKVAPLDIPILVTGESGTGKELVAHSLHQLSPRRDAAMVMVNAAALPATLVESELFGYEAGAFTGANKKGHKGKFEQAADGTIFLDEIGDMPLEIQVKLLRVLQDKSWSGSAATGRTKSIFDWSRRLIATCGSSSRRISFASISTIASPRSRSKCRRSGTKSAIFQISLNNS